MTKTVSHNTADLRRINRNRVFTHLLFHAPEGIKKQDLALALNMSLPTLTQNLGELFALGLVNNDRTGESSGGRPPRILTVTAGARWAMGVELSANHIRMVALDLLARELDFQTVHRPFRLDKEYAAALAQTIEYFLQSTSLDREKLLGVGLTIPGIVTADEARIVLAPTLDLREVAVKELTGRIPYPIHIVNDANAGGYAECWGKTEAESMAYLSLGRGVGGAILFSGATYLGQDGRSGEFGHICIHPGGALCSCGRKGCLEAYCSTALLSDELGVSLEEFFAKLEQGDRRYAGIWDTYLDHLTLGIHNIHIALDCPIVLGGKLSHFLPQRLDELDRRLREADPDYLRKPYLSVCRYHDRANSVGAALHFIEKFVRQV